MLEINHVYHPKSTRLGMIDCIVFDFQGLQYFDVWRRKTGEKTNQFLKDKKKQVPNCMEILESHCFFRILF